MDIDSWLRSLSLEQYEATFRDNAIDGKVLPRLTAEDLKDLGVDLVGHRRTLLDAIAALRGDANEKEPPFAGTPLFLVQEDSNVVPLGPDSCLARERLGTAVSPGRQRAAWFLLVRCPACRTTQAGLHLLDRRRECSKRNLAR